MTGVNRHTIWHRRALNAEVPVSAYLELTHLCNLACGFCCNRRSVEPSSLNLEEWLDLLDQLRQLGTLYINLTGGEPLIHPHWREILCAARRRAFAARLLTNATLIDGDAADAIADARPLSVETTIHGATAEVHDRTTQHTGSFEATWRGIDRLRERGVMVILKTVITRVNAGQIGRIIELAADRNLPLRLDPQILPRDDGRRAPLEWATSGELEGIDSTALPGSPLPQVPGTVGCGLGRSTMTIDPAGQVFPCILWRESSYGSTRSAPLDQLWQRPLRRRVAALAVVTDEVKEPIDSAMERARACPAAARRLAGVNDMSNETIERSVAR
jgi:MoaA/NifB/PqqE/SkfB family radical SAM enzyme